MTLARPQAPPDRDRRRRHVGARDRRLRVGRRRVRLRPRRLGVLAAAARGSASTCATGHDRSPPRARAWRWSSPRRCADERTSWPPPRELGLRVLAPRRAPGRDRGAAALDLRRRRPRQDDHDGHDRLRGRADRARSDLARRRRRAPARRKRRARAGATCSWPRPTSRTAALRCCGRTVAVVTNVDLDHHARYALAAPRCERAVRRAGSPRVPADGAVVVGDGVGADRRGAGARGSGRSTGADWHVAGFRRPARTASRLLAVDARRARRSHVAPRGPRRAQRPQRRRRARRAGTRPGRARRRGRRRCATSPAPAAASSCAATVAGATVVDDYAHHPTELAAAIDAARTYAPGAGGGVLPAAPVLAHRSAGATSSARRSRGADEVVVTEIYAGARAPGRGRHGEARRRRASSERRPGHAARLHAAARRRGRVPARAGCAPGDLVLTGGRGRRAPGGRPAAGDERCCRPASRRDYPIVAADDDRHRRAGAVPRPPGDARRSCTSVLRWAGAEELEVAVVGLGSNLLVADDGLRRPGRAARGRAGRRIERDGDRVGVRRRRVARRRSSRAATGWGLAGIEFGCAIPGTAGGAVRMNAGALRRRAARRARDGRRSSGRAARGAATPAALEMTLPPLERGRGRGRRRGRAAARARTIPSRIRATRRRHAAPPPRGPAGARCARSGAVWKNPSGDAQRRPAARGVRPEGLSRSAAPASRRCTRTSSRTSAAPPRRTCSR